MTRADPTRIRALVEFLCSEPCAGRAPGTPEGRAARDRVQRELAAAGALPAGPGGEWLQPVPGCGGDNVLGRLPGARERSIVVGAHYDHLGRTGNDAYWGADDNAAAVAILVEVAHLLRGVELGREVLLCAFDAEEPPHFHDESMGSIHYVKHPPVPLERVDAMVCMDLVGHALGPAGLTPELRDSLFVLGAGRGVGLGAVVDATPRPAGVIPRRVSCEVIPALSDYFAFDRARIPFLFLTCGRWEHYHEVTDTPEKLAYEKIAATAEWLAALVVNLAAHEGPFPYVPGGSDDLATVASLRAVGEALGTFDPRALALRAALATFPSKEPFTPGQRQRLSALVGMIESALG
ncbi:MAG: M28 family metallopeptidase [Planctomycetota bacterium]